MKRTKRKALGQHFLKSPSVLKKIIRSISPQKDELIIEIGAGKGALTFPLAEKAGKVIAIEKDRSLIPYLQRKKFLNLEIVEEDVLKVNFQQILEKEKNFKGKVKVVGNLPYSISSPLLFKIFAARELFAQCIFLLQSEVAERITSQPGSKRYAPLSILFQNYFLAKLHFFVEPEAFLPPPKVRSALISLKRRDCPLYFLEKEELFHKFLKDSFRHRRKILLNNLKRLNLSDSLLREAYEKCHLEKNVRPEQLTLSQFVELFNFFYRNSEEKKP